MFSRKRPQRQRSFVFSQRRLHRNSRSPKPNFHRNLSISRVIRPTFVQRHTSPRRTFLHQSSNGRRRIFNQRPQTTIKRNTITRRNSRKKNSTQYGGPPISDRFPPEFELNGSYISVDKNITMSLPCPTIFQPTYVLSIRAERFANFLNRFGSWNAYCKRSNCIVGKYLDKNKLYREGTINREGGRLKNGEIGCWLSHYNSWKCIAESPYGYGTVIEDDADIKCSYETLQHVTAAMNELEETHTAWDVLFWCISPIPHVKQGLQPCPLSHWLRVPKNHCIGCIAYTITKSVAQHWVRQSKPIFNPVDVWVSQRSENLNVYCIKPTLGSIVPTLSDTAETTHPGYIRFL